MQEDTIAYKKVTDKFQDVIHFEESEMWLVGNESLWPYVMKELHSDRIACALLPTEEVFF